MSGRDYLGMDQLGIPKDNEVLQQRAARVVDRHAIDQDDGARLRSMLGLTTDSNGGDE